MPDAAPAKALSVEPPPILFARLHSHGRFRWWLAGGQRGLYSECSIDDGVDLTAIEAIQRQGSYVHAYGLQRKAELVRPQPPAIAKSFQLFYRRPQGRASGGDGLGRCDWPDQIMSASYLAMELVRNPEGDSAYMTNILRSATGHCSPRLEPCCERHARWGSAGTSSRILVHKMWQSVSNQRVYRIEASAFAQNGS